MVDFGLNVMSPFSLEGRQAECHNRLFLQNGLDRICAQLARSKSLATFASFTDYAGNGKQILKIMEAKENKRVLNVRIFIAQGGPDNSQRLLQDHPKGTAK